MSHIEQTAAIAPKEPTYLFEVQAYRHDEQYCVYHRETPYAHYIDRYTKAAFLEYQADLVVVRKVQVVPK